MRYRKLPELNEEIKFSLKTMLNSNKRGLLGKKEAEDLSLFTHCLRCGKFLKSEKSKKLGYGPVCYRRHLKEEKNSRMRRLF